MRRFAITRSAAAALAACTLLAGCDDGGPAAGASPSAEPEPTATATSAPTTVATTLPGPRPTPATPGNMSSAGDPATATPIRRPSTPATPGTVDPDRPGDPVRGFRVLNGTVEPGAGCRVIRSGGERWALLGVLAGTLRVGETYEVRGRTVAAPRGCRTDRAIDVSQARRS